MLYIHHFLGFNSKTTEKIGSLEVLSCDSRTQTHGIPGMFLPAFFSLELSFEDEAHRSLPPVLNFAKPAPAGGSYYSTSWVAMVVSELQLCKGIYRPLWDL